MGNRNSLPEGEIRFTGVITDNHSHLGMVYMTVGVYDPFKCEMKKVIADYKIQGTNISGCGNTYVKVFIPRSSIETLGNVRNGHQIDVTARYKMGRHLRIESVHDIVSPSALLDRLHENTHDRNDNEVRAPMELIPSPGNLILYDVSSMVPFSISDSYVNTYYQIGSGNRFSGVQFAGVITEINPSFYVKVVVDATDKAKMDSVINDYKLWTGHSGEPGLTIIVLYDHIRRQWVKGSAS